MVPLARAMKQRKDTRCISSVAGMEPGSRIAVRAGQDGAVFFFLVWGGFALPVLHAPEGAENSVQHPVFPSGRPPQY